MVTITRKIRPTPVTVMRTQATFQIVPDGSKFLITSTDVYVPPIRWDSEEQAKEFIDETFPEQK
jgi:hypothetical protein